MNKILAYYSIVIVGFAVIMCIFASDGDTDSFIGGLMFAPALYYLWSSTDELKRIDQENKETDKIRKEEEMRNEIREEMYSTKQDKRNKLNQ